MQNVPVASSLGPPPTCQRIVFMPATPAHSGSDFRGLKASGIIHCFLLCELLSTSQAAPLSIVRARVENLGLGSLGLQVEGFGGGFWCSLKPHPRKWANFTPPVLSKLILILKMPQTFSSCAETRTNRVSAKAIRRSRLKLLQGWFTNGRAARELEQGPGGGGGARSLIMQEV